MVKNQEPKNKQKVENKVSTIRFKFSYGTLSLLRQEKKKFIILSTL